ncbi:DUF6745 domain-containing protein [Micromonospora sp. NPDC003776]
MALAAGPRWPFADVAVMTQRPTLLRFNAGGQLHAEDEPAVLRPDGSQMRARDGEALPPRSPSVATRTWVGVRTVPVRVTATGVEGQPCACTAPGRPFASSIQPSAAPDRYVRRRRC